MDQDNLRSEVRRYLTLSDMTIQDMAFRCHISRQTLSSFLNGADASPATIDHIREGISKPDRKEVIDVCGALGVIANHPGMKYPEHFSEAAAKAYEWLVNFVL